MKNFVIYVPGPAHGSWSWVLGPGGRIWAESLLTLYNEKNAGPETGLRWADAVSWWLCNWACWYQWVRILYTLHKAWAETRQLPQLPSSCSAAVTHGPIVKFSLHSFMCYHSGLRIKTLRRRQRDFKCREINQHSSHSRVFVRQQALVLRLPV